VTTLITGGGGFIGSALAQTLPNVRVFDDFHRGRKPLPCEVVEGDIRNRDALSRALVGVETVIHLAAIAGVGTVVSSPYKTLSVNLGGTQALLDSLPSSVGHIIFFSTSEVYGPNCYKASETDPTTQGPLTEPRWVYATSKLAGEHLVHGYAKEHGIVATIIRPFNVYGPGQIGEGAIHWFVKRAVRDEPLTVHGDGTQIRSWCYVDDCVNAVVTAMGEETSEVYNVGNPYVTMSTLGLAERVVDLTQSKSTIVRKPIAYPEIDVRVPNIAKAEQRLNFYPTVGLTEGLLRTIAVYP
jgi:UDP-glucose 4-epimerase